MSLVNPILYALLATKTIKASFLKRTARRRITGQEIPKEAILVVTIPIIGSRGELVDWKLESSKEDRTRPSTHTIPRYQFTDIECFRSVEVCLVIVVVVVIASLAERIFPVKGGGGSLIQ